MNEIEKKLGQQESEHSIDVHKQKEQKEKKIIDESRHSTFALAEKVLLNPLKKGLDALKSLILPEKIKKEVFEKIDHLEKDKQNDEKEAVLWSKRDLRQLQNHVQIPSYYVEYAKKWVVAEAQSKAAQSLILDISQKDPNPVADLLRKVAERGLS